MDVQIDNNPDDIDAEGFRANVGIILSRDAGSVLIGGRAGQRGWQFPQGGIRKDESPIDAMYRELEEEIGLTHNDVTVLGKTSNWLRYRLPNRYVRRNRQPLCVGQKQIWYLLGFNGDDHRLELNKTELPEFDRWRWVDFWYPVKAVIYFKRRVYINALTELAPVLFPGGAPPQPKWWREDWEMKDAC